MLKHVLNAFINAHRATINQPLIPWLCVDEVFNDKVLLEWIQEGQCFTVFYAVQIFIYILQHMWMFCSIVGYTWTYLLKVTISDRFHMYIGVQRYIPLCVLHMQPNVEYRVQCVRWTEQLFTTHSSQYLWDVMLYDQGLDTCNWYAGHQLFKSDQLTNVYLWYAWTYMQLHWESETHAGFIWLHSF